MKTANLKKTNQFLRILHRLINVWPDSKEKELKSRKGKPQESYQAGDLKEAFIEAIEKWEHAKTRAAFDGQSIDTVLIKVMVNNREVPIHWLLDQLSKCTDIIPSEICAYLNLPEGSTFAQGVHSLRKYLE